MERKQEVAETLALMVLEWLAGQDDLLGVFMGATGSTEADLLNRVSEPEFLAAILDFMLLDDAWVVAFMSDRDVSAEAILQARQALPGGAETHWT
ncbi:MAG: DUF3572 domain-containing protein [Pseudomonadota bacterium]